jgi:hypothetical protein
MTLERARLRRLPEPATIEEYEQAAAELEGVLRELPGVVAIYRTGSVSVPGISDLDRIAVVEEGSQLPDVWNRLSPRTRYLAMHSPFAVDRQTLVRHRWFANLEPFELVWGEPVAVEKPPIPEYSDLLVAAESLVVDALKLLKQQSTGRVKVRPLLCELNNLRRDLVLAGVDRTDAPNAWSLAEGVTRLRAAWWSLPPKERSMQFRELLASARSAVHEALAALPIATTKHARPLRLAREWSNVALVAANGSRDADQRLWLRIIPGRAAQRAWHLYHYEIGIPDSVLALIGGGDGTHDRFRSERRDIVRRYLEFAAKSAPAYSGLGTAGVFLNE